MDPQRRADLVQPRQALRENIGRREQLYGLEDLKAALEAAGEPHEILYAGEGPSWSPSWIPWGYSRVPWHLVRPAEGTWFRSNLAARDEAVISALARLAAPDEPLFVVYEGRAASFLMSRAVIERNIAAVMEAGWEPIWISAPPKQWLVEVSNEDVRVGDAFPPAAEDAASQAPLGAFLSSLDARGASYLVFDDEDPGRPPLPDVAWDMPLPPLRLTLAASDRTRLHETVHGFLAGRVAPDEPVQVAAATGPRLQLGRGEFERCLRDIGMPAVDIDISGPGARWALTIRPRTQTWVQGIG
jgi:hypothetical protein